MPMLKNVLGLDLGSHSIKAVEFEQSLRGAEALQMRGVERNVDDAELPELLRQFIEQYRLPNEHIVAALPGDQVSTRRFRFPFRERRKISAALPHMIADDLPFEPEDILFDWELTNAERAQAEVIATVAPRKEVSAFLEPLVEAECEPRTLEVEGLVLGNLAAVFELTGVRLLIDLGHRKTTLCMLLDERAVSARTVPLGGLSITQALAMDREIDHTEADRMKCEERILVEGFEEYYPATAAALDRITREIIRTLGSFGALLGGRPVDELTLMGGTALMDGLDAYLTERTSIPAEKLGYPPPGKDAGLVAAGDPVLFAPTIALGLRGTARARTRMNFRQDEFAVRLDFGRFGRDFIVTSVLAVCALILGVASFTTSTLMESRRAAQLEAEIARLYSEAVPGSAASGSPVRALREAVDSANRRAQFLGVYRGNLSALDLLTEVSKLVPKDLDILLEELSIDRQTLRMRVRSQSFEAADRLGEQLATFAPFTDARIGAIETDKKTNAKRFSVTISIGAEVDAQ